MTVIVKQRKLIDEKHNFLIKRHPIIQRIYQTRGVTTDDELNYGLQQLPHFSRLLNIEKAVALLATALQQQQHIMIVGDFDADGATSTAVAMRSLRLLGAEHVSFFIPDRFKFGYGLTPKIITAMHPAKPDLIMTVDNGISSIAGVAAAQEKGIKVLITDHHLPADSLPIADAIVNPNQSDDSFPTKNIAGVGVCFYVMLALRAYLREQDWFTRKNINLPKLAILLDIVALGTVADVVPLDKTNRIFVSQGLRRIRCGRCVPGIKALADIAKRDITRLTAADLGFFVAPRLNAAGRLENMSLGVKCLLSDDIAKSKVLASRLNDLNFQRRKIETDMQEQALIALKKITLNDAKMLPTGLSLFDEHWHQGVIGILASRLKERYHRPVIAFAPADNDEIKGSARSVSGLHIRDLLDKIAKQHPQLIDKFGGHAMAAGLSIKKRHFLEFSNVFDNEAQQELSDEDLQCEILTDGSLSTDELSLRFAEMLANAGPWGQTFPEPIFYNEFNLIEQRVVGQNHLRLCLQYPGTKKLINAIKFNVDLKSWPNYQCDRVCLAYKLDINEFNDTRSIQLLVEYIESTCS